MPIGGMLLGTEIKKAMDEGKITITGCPNGELRINPNSVNLTLNKFLKMYATRKYIGLEFNAECSRELIKGMEEYKKLTGKESKIVEPLPRYLDMRKKNEVYDLAIPEDG